MERRRGQPRLLAERRDAQPAASLPLICVPPLLITQPLSFVSHAKQHDEPNNPYQMPITERVRIYGWPASGCYDPALAAELHRQRQTEVEEFMTVASV